MADLRLLQLAALARLDRAFDALHAQPWCVDARAGVVRVGDEPVVLPRDWLRRDPDRSAITRTLREAWDFLSYRPVSRHVDHDVRALLWHLHAHFFYAYDDDECPGRHWYVPLVEGWRDDARCPPEDDSCWLGFATVPDLWQLLPSILADALHGEFAAFAPDSGKMSLDDSLFIDDLATALHEQLGRYIDANTFTAAVWLLATEDHDHPGVDDAPPRRAIVPLADCSPLQVEAERLEVLRDDARLHWDAREQSLVPMLPLAMCAGHAPTPDGVREWLRDNGCTRSALHRMPHLPPATADALFAEWMCHPRRDWRGPIAWLGVLLSMLHARRGQVIDTRELVIAGQVTAAAGLAGALPPRMPAITQSLRAHPGHRWYGMDTGDDALCPVMVSTVCRYRADTGSVLARALLGALMDASITRQPVFNEHLQGVFDWIVGCQYFGGEAETLLPRDVGPDWSALVRGQRRWHEKYAHVRMPWRARRLPPEGVSWDSPSGPVESGEYRLEPLVTNSALQEEGIALGHCVETYWPRCMANECRLFSLRLVADGTRLGTLELRPDRPRWRIAQFRGWHNVQLLTPEGLPKAPYDAVVSALLEKIARDPPAPG